MDSGISVGIMLETMVFLIPDGIMCSQLADMWKRNSSGSCFAEVNTFHRTVIDLMLAGF